MVQKLLYSNGLRAVWGSRNTYNYYPSFQCACRRSVGQHHKKEWGTEESLSCASYGSCHEAGLYWRGEINNAKAQDVTLNWAVAVSSRLGSLCYLVGKRPNSSGSGPGPSHLGDPPYCIWGQCFAPLYGQGTSTCHKELVGYVIS